MTNGMDTRLPSFIGLYPQGIENGRPGGAHFGLIGGMDFQQAKEPFHHLHCGPHLGGL